MFAIQHVKTGRFLSSDTETLVSELDFDCLIEGSESVNVMFDQMIDANFAPDYRIIPVLTH